MAKPPTFQHIGIDHVVLRAKDIGAMLHFYRDVLGCAIAKHNEPLGLYHLRVGYSLIDLVDMTGKLGAAGGSAPDGEHRNVDHIALRIEPFDEWELRANFEANGVEMDPAATRFGADGDGPSVYVRDPEGNGVELKGPPTRPI